jgi:hypothetical protein
MEHLEGSAALLVHSFETVSTILWMQSLQFVILFDFLANQK